MSKEQVTLCPHCDEGLRKPWNISAILEHDPLNLLGSPVPCTTRPEIRSVTRRVIERNLRRHRNCE